VQDLRKPLQYLLTETATVESSPGLEPIDEKGALQTCEHYRMRGSCRDFIGKYPSSLSVIVVLQKSGLITGRDVTKADSPLALMNSE
jgi:hypothetical protein